MEFSCEKLFLDCILKSSINQVSSWDDVESETEMARLRSHDRPSSLQGYTRWQFLFVREPKYSRAGFV